MMCCTLSSVDTSQDEAVVTDLACRITDATRCAVMSSLLNNHVDRPGFALLVTDVARWPVR